MQEFYLKRNFFKSWKTWNILVILMVDTSVDTSTVADELFEYVWQFCWLMLKGYLGPQKQKDLLLAVLNFDEESQT